MMNTCLISGRVANDIKLKYNRNGVPFCRFVVVCQRPFTEKGIEPECDYISIEALKGKAEFAARNFTKGTLIEIVGSIRTSSYFDIKAEENRSTTYIRAIRMDFAPTNNGKKNDYDYSSFNIPEKNARFLDED